MEIDVKLGRLFLLKNKYRHYHTFLIDVLSTLTLRSFVNLTGIVTARQVPFQQILSMTTSYKTKANKWVVRSRRLIKMKGTK